MQRDPFNTDDVFRSLNPMSGIEFPSDRRIVEPGPGAPAATSETPEGPPVYTLPSGDLRRIAAHSLVRYARFSRPESLRAPTLAALAGCLAAVGADPPQHLAPTVFLNLALVTLTAGTLARASRAADRSFEITRGLRASRTAEVSPEEARAVTWILHAFALVFAWSVNAPCFLVAATILVLNLLPWFQPSRLGARDISGHAVLALTGLLLPVAGWSSIKTLFAWEPWYLGLTFMLFLWGASSLRDFEKMEEDRARGVPTLPTRFGPVTAAWWIAPLLPLSFLMLPLGAALGILSGDASALVLLGFGMAVWAGYAAQSLVRDPLARGGGGIFARTHPAAPMWTAQVGLMFAYLL